MPLPSTTNGIPLTTHTCVGASIGYPFRDNGDSSTKVYSYTMQGALSTYAPLDDNDEMTTAGKMPVRSPFPDDANAFFVGDTKPTPIDGGLVEYVRTFANIPQSRIDPYGFYAFEFPIVPGGIQKSNDSTSESSSYNTGTFTLSISATLSAADALDFSNGEIVTIVNPSSWSYDSDGLVFYTKYEFKGAAIKNGNTITIKVYDFFYQFQLGTKIAYDNFTDNGATKYIVKKIVSPARTAAQTINSPSQISFRYIKTQSSSEISLASPFKLQNSSGVETDATSDTTVPTTTTQYQNSALNGEYIGAENETINRWKGNIFEVQQIRVLMK